MKLYEVTFIYRMVVEADNETEATKMATSTVVECVRDCGSNNEFNVTSIKEIDE